MLTPVPAGEVDVLRELGRHVSTSYALAVRLLGTEREAEALVKSAFAWAVRELPSAGAPAGQGWLLLLRRQLVRLAREKLGSRRPQNPAQFCVLDFEHRAALVLDGLEQLSDEDVAHALDCNPHIAQRLVEGGKSALLLAGKGEPETLLAAWAHATAQLRIPTSLETALKSSDAFFDGLEDDEVASAFEGVLSNNSTRAHTGLVWRAVGAAGGSSPVAASGPSASRGPPVTTAILRATPTPAPAEPTAALPVWFRPLLVVGTLMLVALTVAVAYLSVRVRTLSAQVVTSAALEPVALSPASPPSHAPVPGGALVSAAAPGAAPVSTAVPPLPETLSNADITKVILAHSDELDACVDEQERLVPSSSGELRMRWRVQLDGTTSEVAPLEGPFATSFLAKCIGERIAQWTFPAHRVAREPIEFPFTF